jgi:rare lipoprotein A (peptidoglycan hydrolase)
MNARSHPLSCKLSPVPIRNLQPRYRGLARCLAGLLVLMFVSFAPVRAMAPTRHHAGETESGMASWYGADQGHQTASGERFDPDALTAATCPSARSCG